MILVSLRVPKKWAVLTCGLLCAAAAILAVVTRFYPQDQEVAVSLPAGEAVTKNYTITGNEDRLEFIAQFGLEVEEEPCEIEEIVIPQEFDAVYQKYNEIQKAQGLDLSRYAGKKVKRFCYRVLNYPGCEDEVRLNLLVAENKVVGGDVSSLALDGFMHGFRYEG